MSRRNRRSPKRPLLALTPWGRAQAWLLGGFRLGFIAMLAVGIALLAGSGGRAFMGIDALRLGTVDVRGAHRASREALLAAAQTTLGDPLLRIDLSRAAQGIQEHPWVQHATLRRQLPDRLHIDVVEHVPRALAMLGDLWLVNGDGEPFKRFAAADRLVLPVITGVVPTTAAPGELSPQGPRPQGDDRPSSPQDSARVKARLRAGLALLDDLHGRDGVKLDVQEVHFDEDLGWSAIIVAHGYQADTQAVAQGDPAKPQNHAMLVHLGVHPHARVSVLAPALARLAASSLSPTVIWADGERVPNRVQVQLQKPPDGPLAKSPPPKLPPPRPAALKKAKISL